MFYNDNDVYGDNIYLRELKNFFFEVLGMMSITHYGAIGDGRTDNYGPLQVAIDDANRRGLNYIYVPYGRFIYTGELLNIGNITFIGNPNAHIVNIRTAEEIEITQFGSNITYEPGENIDITGNIISAILNIATSISSSSTDDEIASAKAVYNYVDEMITQAIGGDY